IQPIPQMQLIHPPAAPAAPRAWTPMPALPSAPAVAGRAPSAAVVEGNDDTDDDDDEDVEEVPAQINNLSGAPLVIDEANMRVYAKEGKIKFPEIILSNDSDMRIKAFKVRFKPIHSDAHAVTAVRTDIAPHDSFAYKTGVGLIVKGNPQVHVQILGVVFEDGSVWGEMNSTIHSRDVDIPVNNAIRKSK